MRERAIICCSLSTWDWLYTCSLQILPRLLLVEGSFCHFTPFPITEDNYCTALAHILPWIQTFNQGSFLANSTWPSDSSICLCNFPHVQLREFRDFFSSPLQIGILPWLGSLDIDQQLPSYIYAVQCSKNSLRKVWEKRGRYLPRSPTISSTSLYFKVGKGFLSVTLSLNFGGFCFLLLQDSTSIFLRQFVTFRGSTLWSETLCSRCITLP